MRASCARRQRDQLGVGADAGAREHAISRRVIGDARAGRNHRAGAITARDEGRRDADLVFAPDQQRVDEVHAGGMDAHQQLSRPRSRVGQLAEHQGRRRSVFAADNGAHIAMLLPGARMRAAIYAAATAVSKARGHYGLARFAPASRTRTRVGCASSICHAGKFEMLVYTAPSSSISMSRVNERWRASG